MRVCVFEFNYIVELLLSELLFYRILISKENFSEILTLNKNNIYENKF